MKCPQCHQAELEYEDDPNEESWNDYLGWYNCPKCKRTFTEFQIESLIQGGDWSDDDYDDHDYDNDD